MRQRLRRLSGAEWRAVALRALVFVTVWAVVAVPVSLVFFANDSKPTVIASHDAVVSPSFDGYATLDLGPYIPNFRYPTGTWLGAEIRLGKTNLTSYEALVRRYATIGAQPEGEIAKLRRTLVDMAQDSAVSGALVGLAAPGLWLLLGPRRRAELFRHLTPPRVLVGGVSLTVVVVAVTQPWTIGEGVYQQQTEWEPIDQALPEAPVPEEAASVEVEAGLMTSGTKRIAESLFDSYNRSLAFYKEVVEATDGLDQRLRQPTEDETVAVLVSDRHDNVRMDQVVRAIADEAGATMLMSAGDDTSTGSEWEAFSLDSLDAAFADFDHRYWVAGNHDHGEFLRDYVGDLGFTVLDGETADGPDGIRVLGSHDPRSSGLGSWREETGISFSEHAELVADAACEYDERGDRVSTLLVHDANSGRYALERGCVDLVVGGHVHAQLGPSAITGENGRTGYTYTNGTTGGAAYAIALGSKLRRDAMVTLITYREGRPVGIQPVTVRTVGDFVVGEYVELALRESAEEGTTESPSPESSPLLSPSPSPEITLEPTADLSLEPAARVEPPGDPGNGGETAP